jgi:hypothetical protein
MIKIDDHSNVNLDLLAAQHYQNLIDVPLVDGINYHATHSLIGRIRVQRDLDLAIADLNRVAFWDYLLNNNFANLNRIIVSRPNVLKLIITEIDNLCGVGFFSDHLNYNDATLTDFGRIVKDVFNYKLYRRKPECNINCEQLNLTYCPYCNELVLS